MSFAFSRNLIAIVCYKRGNALSSVYIHYI